MKSVHCENTDVSESVYFTIGVALIAKQGDEKMKIMNKKHHYINSDPTRYSFITCDHRKYCNITGDHRKYRYTCVTSDCIIKNVS